MRHSDSLTIIELYTPSPIEAEGRCSGASAQRNSKSVDDQTPELEWYEFSQKTGLLQLRVLGFGTDENWNVGVGVFPKRKEIFVGGAGLGSGTFSSSTFRELHVHRVGLGEAET